MKTLMVATAAVSSLLFTQIAAADDYVIDAGHSAVTFETGHIGISRLPGQFREFSGNYIYFADNPGKNSVNLEIKVGSLDTNHGDRDKHLRSPDFFDAKQYPTITFKSTGYKGDADKGKLTGQLTMHGVTKEVTFDMVKTGEAKDPWGGYRQGFIASTQLMRSDFGITYFIPGVPDATDLKIFIEGIRQ